MRIILISTLLCLGFAVLVKGQNQPVLTAQEKRFPTSFIENKGQWHENVQFITSLSANGKLYLEKKAITFQLLHPDDLPHLHDLVYPDHKHPNCTGHSPSIRGQNYKVTFLNALEAQLHPIDQRPEYYNYIIGDDPAKWQSEIHSYEAVLYKNLYSNIDLKYYHKSNFFKYDFIIKKGGRTEDIQMHYDEDVSLKIEDGNLLVQTCVDTIVEMKPYAYQVFNGQKREITCNYIVNNNIVSFNLPNGYDKTLELIIDPVVVASTLSGTAASDHFGNFGHTGTYDNFGNLYAGGIAFGVGYPTTTGAFQLEYEDGTTDYCISKYTQDGSTLIYATYIGGERAEYPHSIIVDQNQQLYIYGTTTSDDFPTTTNGYQRNFSGMTDIVISKLNSTGTTLFGSTYMGGTSRDGRIASSATNNYGDIYRGEIILDPQGNVYVASCTSSEDIPTTAGALDNDLNVIYDPGQVKQDGIVFKMNSDLSLLLWSTYLGGDNTDMAMGLRLDDQQNVYVSGTAGGSNFPMPPGGAQASFLGVNDAFLVKLASDGSQVLAGTFWGTDQEDQGFFLDIDEKNNVHFVGQTLGNILVTPGTYVHNPGSRQFVAAFTPNLDQVVYSTVIGSGPGTPPAPGTDEEYDFAPVAFMVDKCDYIYLSGYYGTDALPLTPDAIDTNDDAFYLAVLEPDATGLSFGSFFGNANHVDGGTSRFDKAGIVYQTVCSCDQGNRILNTLPNAWATTQNNDCDAGIFKIDFERNTVTSAAAALPAASGCAPFTVDFQFTGQDAESVYWDFGDNSTSTTVNPTHTFQDAGSYVVTIIAESPTACNFSDTSYMFIDVLDGQSQKTDTFSCELNPILIYVNILNASYVWQDGSTGSSMIADSSGTFWVDISLGPCSRRDSFEVLFSPSAFLNLESEYNGCHGQCLGAITATPTADPSGLSYLWSNQQITNEINGLCPGIYDLTVFDSDGCSNIFSSEVTEPDPINFDIEERDIPCFGETSGLINIINIFGGVPPYRFRHQYSNFSDTTLYNNLPADTYIISMMDTVGCLLNDTIEITQPPSFMVNAGNDQEVELGDPAFLNGYISMMNGLEHYWVSGDSLECEECLFQRFLPTLSGWHYLIGKNENGCTEIDSVFINVLPIKNEFIPNAFTPNGDGLNDRITVFANKAATEVLIFRIFDRWGEMVYEGKNFPPNDPQFGWDGSYKGKPLNPAVFTYYAEVAYLDRTVAFVKGDITLLR